MSSAWLATGVNAEGQREILGMDVGTSEDGRSGGLPAVLTARGLSGVELVTSGSPGAEGHAAVFAGASWQRCRTHFMANLLTRVPKRAQSWRGHHGAHHLPPRSTAN